jgi:NADH:ubiquinone oxidoreductase subunit 5 (subunit L)/multisubunit Na+/H+ antiporter MnhA subunit
MRRTLALAVLIGFLGFTGIYLFVYLFRAFRLPEPAQDLTVQIWHGDPMTRAVLVAVLFAIGLILLLLVTTATTASRRSGTVQVRPDLWEWLTRRAEETNDDPHRIADRALARYRDETESTMHRR